MSRECDVPEWRNSPTGGTVAFLGIERGRATIFSLVPSKAAMVTEDGAGE